MALQPGARLGPYEIVGLIGAGGMGEVYRARDRRLGRDVAIKVLPDALSADADRLMRFEREARLLAALNHPHISAIYGVEQSLDICGLVLELVEGQTLTDLIARTNSSGARGLPLKEALLIARQIADALGAAHEKGIVHRDLKSDNVKVTPRGIVKVLDFGLAKIWTAAGSDAIDAATVTSGDTRAGALLGTPAYMSPEQARGLAIDRRADTWAFGCVLFEMLTGRRPFAGRTVADTLACVLEREPEWSELSASTPARVRTLLRRCLEKDPEKRLCDMAEARAHVDAGLASPVGPLRAVRDAARWNLSRPGVRWTMAGLAVLLAAFMVHRVRSRDGPMLQLANPLQVTSAVGVEDHPTVSPDNRTVAYESNEAGNWDIWLVQVGEASAVNRTADYAGNDRYPSWSPDGRHVAFWSDREGGGYFVMPALGGAPTRMIPTPGIGEYFHSAPEWSADGTQLAGVTYSVVASRFQQSVEIVSIVTRDARRLALPGSEEARLDLSWSRDGRYLAYVDAGQQQSEISWLRVMRLSDGQATAVTNGRSNARRPRWSPDGQALFYVCNCAGPRDLWQQPFAHGGAMAGAATRVTNGLEIGDAALSPDGTKLVYSKGRWVSNIWRVPILEDRPATWADATQVTFDQAFVEFVDVSPDGLRLAYSSDRTGNQDLWILPIGGTPVQVTSDPAPDWSPGWSPDGKTLAFYSYRSGDREIWTMPATGGAATQLTHSPGLDAGSHWSPDGRMIAFRSERTGDSEVWVITSDGRTSRQLTNHPASDGLATWSPDSQWLAFTSNRSGKPQIWRVAMRGGEPEPLTRGPATSPRWSRDGAHIYFAGALERAGNIWRLSLADLSERAMTSLAGKRGTTGIMPPATDGRVLYFSWRDDLGDIWMMDILRR